MKIDVIEAFTVGARVLVTTRDESVVKNLPVQDKKLISMLPGLSQEESLKVMNECPNKLRLDKLENYY